MLRRLVAAGLLWLFSGCGSEPPRDGERASLRPPVEQVQDGCRVVADEAKTAEWVLRSCARAAHELELLLGSEAPRGAVLVTRDTLAVERAARDTLQRWLLAVDPDSLPVLPLEIAPGRRISREGYLAHEIAHRMATSMLFSQAGDSVAAGPVLYGSPLPDWMDEALALAVEPEADQQTRLGLLFEDSMIFALPLRRFLYMPHPVVAGAAVGSPVRRTFYGQALAFARFVRERGGDAGFRKLVEALRTGERQGRALTGVPGLPEDGGRLEQEWLAWLRTHQSAPR